MTRRILFLTLLSATLVLAQGKKGGGGRGSDMGAVSFGPSAPFDRISEMLKLDKDQKKDLKTTFDEAQKQATPVHDQIVKSRLAIGEAVVAGKSQDEIGQAVNAEAALESQMTEIELRAFAKVYTALNQDQQARVAPLFQMMRGMFSKKNWNSTQ
jgi:hypothetical protein